MRPPHAHARSRCAITGSLELVPRGTPPTTPAAAPLARPSPPTFFYPHPHPHQAAWVFITLSPVLLLTTASAGGPAALLWSDIVGGALFATGLAVEAVADAQKFKFKMDPANKGRFIDTGLWRNAR